MTGWIVAAVVVTFLVIALDVVKGIRNKSRRRPTPTHFERAQKESISRESERTNCSTAPLLPRYSEASANGIFVPPVETATMRPPSFTRLAASRRVKNTPFVFALKT